MESVVSHEEEQGRVLVAGKLLAPRHLWVKKGFVSGEGA